MTITPEELAAIALAIGQIEAEESGRSSDGAADLYGRPPRPTLTRRTRIDDPRSWADVARREVLMIDGGP